MSILTVFTGGATTEVLTQQPPAGANSILVNLAPNTAVDLGAFTITPPGGETLSQARQLGGNGGMDWDPVRMQIAIFGGGHSGTNYNGVMTLSAVDLVEREHYVSTPAQPDMTWANYDTQMLPGLGGVSQVGRGAFLQDLSAVGGPYPRPAARHTGSLIQVIGDYLYLFASVEGNGSNTQQAILLGQPGAVYVFNCKAQVARYHLVNKTWEFENKAIPQTDGNGGNLPYGATAKDPVTGKIVWVDNFGFYTYDPTTFPGTKIVWVSNWFPVSGSKVFDEAGNHITSNTLMYTQSLVYDSIRDKFYFITLHDEVYRVNYDRANPAATTLTRLTVTGTSPYAANAHPPNSEHSHRFDTKNGVIGVGPFAGVFYTFDPVSKAWSHVTIANYTGSQYGNSHMMEYLDGVNVYIFLTDGQYANAAMKYRWVAYRYA